MANRDKTFIVFLFVFSFLFFSQVFTTGILQCARSVVAVTRGSDFFETAIYSDGNVYAAGKINSSAVTYDFKTGLALAVPYSDGNVVLVNYDSNGNAQSVKSVAAGSSGSSFSGVAVGSCETVCIAGYIFGNNIYDLGNGVKVAGTFAGDNVFLVKCVAICMTAIGILLWHYKYHHNHAPGARRSVLKPMAAA